MPKTEEVKEKKYSLTKEERAELEGRRKVGEYIQELVDRDRSLFVHEVVKPRLSLPPEAQLVIDSTTGEVKAKIPPKVPPAGQGKEEKNGDREQL